MRAAETCLERTGLPEVAAQLDHPQARFGVNQPLRDLERIVAAAIVDENDFGAIPRLEPVTDRGNATHEFTQRGRLVVNRGDDADQWAMIAGTAMRIHVAKES
jgi:hypothetical protein